MGGGGGGILSVETSSIPHTEKNLRANSASETIKTNPLQIHHSPYTVQGNMHGVYPGMLIVRFDRGKASPLYEKNI